jgi:hypothetical protein
MEGFLLCTGAVAVLVGLAAVLEAARSRRGRSRRGGTVKLMGDGSSPTS